jgi:hypothetical protein
LAASSMHCNDLRKEARPLARVADQRNATLEATWPPRPTLTDPRARLASLANSVILLDTLLWQPRFHPHPLQTAGLVIKDAVIGIGSQTYACDSNNPSVALVVVGTTRPFMITAS